MPMNQGVELKAEELRVVGGKDDLVWLKRFRNSKQDQADIENLENEK